jgi:hypothetical protein
MSHRIRVKVTKKTNPVVAEVAREGTERARERRRLRGSNYTPPGFNYAEVQHDQQVSVSPPISAKRLAAMVTVGLITLAGVGVLIAAAIS